MSTPDDDLLRIAATDGEDRDALRALLPSDWGGLETYAWGRVHALADLTAIVAWRGGRRVGAARTGWRPAGPSASA